MSGLNAVVGAWLFVAAFTIDRSVIARWNDAVAGVVVFLLAVSGATASERLAPWRRSSNRRDV